MEENKSKTKGVKAFFKRNAYYLALGGMITALALVVGLSATANVDNSSKDQPVNTTAIEFVSPVANATVLKGYSATELQYDAMLNEWSIHKAVDFSADVSANVYACYDGTVENVSTNVIDGTVVTINHGNNLKTVYKSLDENVNVAVGDKVRAGDIIAKASASTNGETAETSQVHFEVWKDDNLVDPAGYLDLADK